MDGARVLLVEDDPMLCRFVAMALEEMPITLLVCGSVPGAVALLRQAPVRLLISDLMLPGESGLDLLQRLVDEPALRGGALTAVYSAGINPDVRATLDRLGVWRILHKPVSMVELCSCVEDGLAVVAPPASAPRGDTGDAGSGDAARHREAGAIRDYFAGDAALFTTYKASCLRQFPHDRRSAQDALAQGDLAALGRLAHSLKTVLRTLGESAAAEVAARLEHSARAADVQACVLQWPVLESALGQLA